MGMREPGKLYGAVESLLEDQKEPYDTETNVQLAAMDQVDIVLEEIRPMAIQDLLTSFAAEHRTTADDEWPEIEQADVDRLLGRLDALRKPAPPSQGMLNQAITGGRMLLRDEMLLRVRELSNLPWSGDLTYGQALDDVRSALKAAADGTATPTPDWLRCTSKFENSGSGPYRCVLQLPHPGDHHAETAYGTKTWTDEQSTTPPPAAPICAAFRTTAGLTLRCDLPDGHTGDHNDGGQMGRWS